MKIVITESEEVSNKCSDIFKDFEIRNDYLTCLDKKNNDSYLNKECELLLIGKPVYDFMATQDKQGIIHFGLRGYDWGSIKRLPYLSLKDCKIFFVPEFSEEWMDKMIKFYKFDRTKEPKYNMEYDIVTLDDYKPYLEKLDVPGWKGFDFESKAFPHDYDFDPVGVGIAHKDYACYFDFRYYSSQKVKDEFLNDLKDFLIRRQLKIWAYYNSFEVNALKRMYNKYFKLSDCLAMIKADDNSGALKYTAQYYLGVNSWDDDQDELNEKLAVLFRKFKSYKELECYIKLGSDYHKEYENDNDYEKINNIWTELNNLKFDPIMLDKYWKHPFACTPTDITGKYCCYDAFYTLKIATVIQEKYGFRKDDPDDED